MASPKEVIERELKKLNSDRGLRFKSGVYWIRCPWHNSGRERTPSMKISMDGVNSPIGFCYCFGCSKKGPWNMLAQKLGLRELKKQDMYIDSPDDVFSDADDQSLLGSDDAIIPKDSMEWPKELYWRNISGRIVNRVGGVHYFDHLAKQPRLFLPVKVQGEIVGGVRANIIPVEGGNYFNTEGIWVKHSGLFPYDHVRKRMDCRLIVLVEGPRDCLNLIQHGVSSVAILGSAKAWSQEKADLIMALEPNVVVAAFDNDEAGLDAAKQARKSLKKVVKFHHFLFPKKDGEKIDASDLTKRQCHRLAELVLPGYFDHALAA